MLKNGKKAFSIAEVIVSMALIIMVSVAGYMACNIAIEFNSNRIINLQTWSVAESFRSAFANAIAEEGNVDYDENIDDIFVRFNDNIAFFANVQSFSQEFETLNNKTIEDKSSWSIERVSQQFSEESQNFSITISHDNEESKGNPYVYSYVLKHTDYRIEVLIIFAGTQGYLYIDGYIGDNWKANYSYSEIIQCTS